MSPERDDPELRALARWLEANAETLHRDPFDPVGEHVCDERLAEAPPVGALSAAEVAHLSGCVECRTLWRGAHERSMPVRLPGRPARRRAWWVWGLGLAAAAGLALFLAARPPPEPAYRARGAAPPEAPAFGLRAVSPAGEVRAVVSGDQVALGERLGFVYGNVGGQAHTLTVLGYDGARVHWYAPQGPGGAPETLDRGPQSRSSRLPFDVQLTPDHRPGPLTVVAAFDVAPDALAAQLVAGQTPTGHPVVRVSVELRR